MPPLFRTAVFRLTGWYLCIIMLLSVGFSLALYRVSTVELDANQARLESLLQENFFLQRQPGFVEFNQARLEQIEESRRHIQLNLAYFNLIILLAGGAASYFLARRTLRPIEESLEAQQRFTADASHELRTPLTVMKSEIEVALRDKEFDFKQSKLLLKSNLEEIGKLEALSNGLLKLAKQDLDTLSAPQTVIDLHKAISEATERIRPLADERSISLETDIQEVSVKGDHWAIVELLCILLDNAVKYSPSGSIVKLSAGPTRHGHNALLVVKDTGVGISMSDLPHIFDRFYRADFSRTKQAPSGYGLGLSIAKKIVDVHRGSIDVKSIPGKGSTFTVTLPA